MNRPYVPQPVLDAAHARSAARSARDWSLADRLRAEIEAAGWLIVDRGTDFRLEPAHPPDLEEAGGHRFGRSDAVPSRLAEPSTCPATIVLVATDFPSDLDRALAGLRAGAPAGTQIVVVADGPSEAQAECLPVAADGTCTRPGPEVVRTSARLGWAAAWNIGLRLAQGEVVIYMDTSLESAGDVVTPLRAALDVPDAAVVGPAGFLSQDLRRFSETTVAGAAAAIDGALLAFRRIDGAAAGVGVVPRGAVVLPGLPFNRHDHRGCEFGPAAERNRLSKRNFYRFVDRFHDRSDLAVSGRLG
ncbi:MAG: glycosyltransferase [Chloroflexi bacterium]|nr:glycosyltransferase [Chloroflexota bacterium]